MLERAGDYLARRKQQLGLERAEVLEKAQALLDEIYPGQARALSLNGDTLKVVTSNASIASELRLRQVQIIKRLSDVYDLKKLHIQIRG